MSDNKVTLDQLDNSAVEAMTKSVGNVNMLNTENKTIVGAISEIVGKKEIANAIGEPLAETDKFTEMSSEINGLLSTFKTNMMNAGVVVESGDKFKQLIEKIKGLTEGEGNKGIQFAEGTIDDFNINTTSDFKDTEVIFSDSCSFTPMYIFITIGKIYNTAINGDIKTQTNNVISNALYEQFPNNEDYKCYTTMIRTAFGDIEVSIQLNTITNEHVDISIKHNYTNVNVNIGFSDIKYYAIGVGEEDTTLRDSLASILEEEGVSVTEEDNMASLITKVDEEFENTRSTLAGLMQEGGYDITGNESMDRLLDLLVLSGISVSDIKQIACGESHTFILKNDGSLWSCGYNTFGQLGIGASDTNVHGTFTQVTKNINNDVKQIACGHSHTVILKTNGSVWSCGYNKYGQLGLGNTTTVYTAFTQVTTNINNDVKQIACGYNHTVILKNDGSIWSCGENDYGQLGLGTTGSSANKTTFTQVTTNINNDVKQIACGEDHTVILKTNGSVWSCGSNAYGQLGLDDSAARLVFTQVTKNISNDVKQIACGSYNTFILKNDGSVWSCGFNEYGQLGLGNTTNKTSFTQVTTNINNDVKQIACGYYYTFILKNDGSVWGCGDNDYGHLGLGNTNQRTSFTQVTTNINNDVKEVVCGYQHTFILKTNGSVWSCGKNDYGQLGLNDDGEKKSFTQVPRGF